MPSTDLIRPAEPKDYAVIADIYNESTQCGGITFDEDIFSADRIRVWVDKMTDRECLLVIEQDAVLKGWAILKRYSDRPAYRLTAESSIYLTQTAIGQGLGQRLQASLLKHAQALGYHHIVAKIVASNQSSLQFHQRFGYEWVGTQKEVGYSRGQWHDIAILQLLLPQDQP